MTDELRDFPEYPTHRELQTRINDLLTQIDHMREVEEQNAADLLDKSEHIARLIDTAQAEQSENDTLRALNGDLRSLNAELMKQVADLQASEAQTYKAMDEVRHEAGNVATAFQEELALTAELQAEIARLQVVEAQNDDALQGMNDQVIDLHTKLSGAKAQIDTLQRQIDKGEEVLRVNNVRVHRIYQQAKLVKRMAGMLTDDVKL